MPLLCLLPSNEFVYNAGIEGLVVEGDANWAAAEANAVQERFPTIPTYVCMYATL